MTARSMAVVLICGLTALLNAEAPPPSVTVVQNVRIFDGKSGRLSGLSNVLIRGNVIERITASCGR